jgi:hypothetical protein
MEWSGTLTPTRRRQKVSREGVEQPQGFRGGDETESDFAKRHLKDVIIDIYAADIITDELDVRDA